MHSFPYSSSRLAGDSPDPDRARQENALLERALRRIVFIGAMLVFALPAARGHSIWFGALPLWLLGMPLSSWWALHRFRLPSWRAGIAAPGLLRRHTRRVQARRRTPLVRSRQAVAGEKSACAA